MYKLWYCTLKPPIMLSSIEEVLTYTAMMKAARGETPYWEKIPLPKL